MLAIAICTAVVPTIAPQPVKLTIDDTVYPLASPELKCTYADTGAKCADHIFKNFAFFLGGVFPRGEPYTTAEYAKIGVSNAISTATLSILSSSELYDIEKLDESYSISVKKSGITISAANGFAASRAFATLVQLVNVLPSAPEDVRAYGIYSASIEDKAVFPWREILIDGARHYIPLEEIRKTVDAMAASKFNVLHFHPVDAESFPLQFKEAPQSALFKGAYAPQFYYSPEDLEELQEYCFQRGVHLYVEVDMPGHAASWEKADSALVANCPSYKSNINNIPVNPAHPVLYDYIRGIVREMTSEGAYKASHFRKIIGLGGDEVVGGCWKEDPDVSAYMIKHGLDTAGMWREFHQKVYDIIAEEFAGKTRPLQVYWDDSLQNANYFDPENAVIHFWTTTDKSSALSKGLKVIQSTNFYLDQMHPGGGSQYAFAKTWQDFYAVDLLKGVTEAQRPLVLGGGACQWAEWISGPSLVQHMWPRALAIAEVLWSHPASRTINAALKSRLDGLACALNRLGVAAGPIQPGVPCLGYPEK